MRFEVINTLGAVVASQYVAPFQGIINADVSYFAEGLYVAVLKNKKGAVLTSLKFVVKR